MLEDAVGMGADALEDKVGAGVAEPVVFPVGTYCPEGSATPLPCTEDTHPICGQNHYFLEASQERV